MYDGVNLILGKGSFGVITRTNNENVCRKIFTKDKSLSLIREAYMIKKLSHINGITEMITLDHPTDTDILIVQSVRSEQISDVNKRKSGPKMIRPKVWGVIVMKQYHITLRQWLHSNPDFEARLNVLIEIISILSEVHDAGIVHADIKLENIMLTIDGHVKIIDWGLSGPCGYALIHNTTKAYRPKKTAQDFCHDIYSLGVLSIELILGSLIVNRLDYHSCITMLLSTKLDDKLKDLLSRMIHPDCKIRPTIKEIVRFFNSYKSRTEFTDKLLELEVEEEFTITIPPQYGIETMKYPKIFSDFILEHPETLTTINCIIGAIYSSTDPNYLISIIDYDHVIEFINSI